MRRLVLLVTCVLILFSFGCGKKDTTPEGNKKPVGRLKKPD
jgi:hypothetical protein